MTLEKKCVICKKKYKKKGWTSLKNWEKSRYCSRKCLDASKIGNSYKKGKIGQIAWNKGIPQTEKVKNILSKKLKVIAKEKGFGLWMTGKKHTEATKLKMSLAHRDDKSSSWKGDDAKYGAKHMWIYKKLGKPTTCEHCGKTELKGRQIHWANIDHKYKRNLKDWIRLCAKCHMIYDKKQGLK